MHHARICSTGMLTALKPFLSRATLWSAGVGNESLWEVYPWMPWRNTEWTAAHTKTRKELLLFLKACITNISAMQFGRFKQMVSGRVKHPMRRAVLIAALDCHRNKYAASSLQSVPHHDISGVYLRPRHALQACASLRLRYAHNLHICVTDLSCDMLSMCSRFHPYAPL